MTYKTILATLGFFPIHLALVAPFVAAPSILPIGLGAAALTAMAFSLVLAARWRIVDRITGGPDKTYIAHRWLAGFAAAGTIGHSIAASSGGTAIVPFLAESAEGVGVVSGVGLLVLTATALLRAIPYRIWKLSHMLMGPVFVLAAYHTIFISSPLVVGNLPWFAMVLVSVLGLGAWIQTLLRKIAPTARTTIESATRFEDGIDVTLRSDETLPKFCAGQFAALSATTPTSEAHPFTYAGGDATSRRFVIRASGDWTRTFVDTAKVGDPVWIGRSQGRFLPQLTEQRAAQLWVAGGVGIAPFLAALERLRPDQSAPITLIWSIQSRASVGAVADVERHAARLPQLELTLLADDLGESLNEAWLADVLRGLPAKSQAYLCGPAGLTATVVRSWETLGLTGQVHTERFDFRGARGLTDRMKLGKSVGHTARHRARPKLEHRHASLGS